MPIFRRNEVAIHYEIHGSGTPIVLIHGGAVNFEYNYGQFGWIDSLTDLGFQVIGLDLRGHGKSDKPVGTEYYGTKELVLDIEGILEYLAVNKVGIIGYSLGTAIAIELLHQCPERFSRAALIATGDGLMGQPPYVFNDILPGLGKLLSYPEYPAHLPIHVAAYWKFFKDTGLELASMTSFTLADYPYLSEIDVSAIQTPTLVVSGDKDLVLGTGKQLANTLPNGQYSEIEGADHFSLAAEERVQKLVGAFLTAD